MSKLSYYQRIFSAYLTKRKSHLTFWHGIPLVNKNFNVGEIGEYYMPFVQKANYNGQYDNRGIPMLNYHGKVGLQYNPIAIAQYALAHFNLYKKTSNLEHCQIFLRQADWLVENLETNKYGLRVWMHHFDWEYREILKAPWHSALSQGQGISVLVRAYLETGQEKYLESAMEAFEAFKHGIKNGGVKYTDENGYLWLEEAIVDPPTHILNGFIWSLWGVYDYYLTIKDEFALCLFNDSVKTIGDNLHRYDVGFWSLYEQSGTKLKMLSSPFYHKLHVVQLKVMHRLTCKPVFKEFAERWESYEKNRVYRWTSLLYKLIFKLIYY